MTVRFPNHELGSRARVIVGGEELLGTLIGQWATGVRVEVETVMQHRLHDRTEANAYEAGRLAAIRADVALFVRQTDEVAIDAQERAAVLSQQARVFYATRHLKRPHEAREPSIPTMQRMHVLDYRSACICVDQAADCRRWLEATR